MKYFFIVITLIGSIGCLNAQTSEGNKAPVIKEISLKMIAGRTPALDITRNYPIFQEDKGDISSNGSSLFALRAHYAKSFSRNLMWDIGVEAGIDSYHLLVMASEEFLNYGLVKPYSLQATIYDMFYFAAIPSIKYNFPLSIRSAVSIRLGARFTYYIPTGIDAAFNLVTPAGRTVNIFYTFLDSNKNNDIIISPDLGIEYIYQIHNSPFSFKGGLNTSFTRKEFLKGEFRITGDSEILDGEIAKKMMFFQLSLGACYRLP
jgi:hypothetical protein